MILFVAKPARADDTVVIVTGNAPARARDVAASAALSAADLGTKLIASPFLAPEEAALTRCLADSKPWPCMTPTLRTKNVQQLAMLSLTTQAGPDGAAVVVITEQILSATQFAPAGDKRFCDHCTDDVLARLTTELTRDLLREVAARGGRTVVAIQTVPRGAEITFDGKLMGATDQSINTYPGTHSLSLVLDGYQTSNRTIDATEGKTTEVHVQMTKPVADHTAPTTLPPHSVTGLAAIPRWVPQLGVGVGGAAFGIGIVLQATKSSPPVGEPQPRRIYSHPGIGLIIGGSAVALASVALWVHIVCSAPPSTAPTMSVTPGGGVVGWTGRF